MSDLPDGEYLLTNVRWRRENVEEALRPLHGFTTGKLTVRGGDAALSARFNDQFLSNRLSDLDEDGIPVMFQVAVLETEEAYELSCGAPTLDRSGASYRVEGEGSLRTVGEGPAA